VITNVKIAVVCLDRSESIDVVNTSVLFLFGYPLEQLFAHPLASIFASDTNPKPFGQIALMRNGEAPLTFQAHCVGTTDDE
jgi:hypothetical protein